VASVAFTKVEGLGNDFILLDRRELEPEALAAELAWARELAPRVCDRRTGIGGDGILVVGPGDPAAGTEATMIVVNFDGSRPEMCGNGLRCVAMWLAHGARAQRWTGTLATDAGPKLCVVDGHDGGPDPYRRGVTIDMGPAVELGTQTPAAGEGREFVGVSMGNPHAIHLLAEGVETPSPESLARTLGPALELDPAYAPAKTNVEFARLLGPAALELWVWERGVGITQACGTGACATAVAAARAERVPFDEPVEVRLPGGRLQITAPRDPSAGVLMRGPARIVFEGRFVAQAFAG
jgi:diaminopimelate epimerase